MKTIKNNDQSVYSTDIETLAKKLSVTLKTGLNEPEIEARIKAHGLNRYEEQKQKSIFLILWEQFKSPIILLLVLASGVSFGFQHWLEGFSIIGVIFVRRQAPRHPLPKSRHRRVRCARTGFLSRHCFAKLWTC